MRHFMGWLLALLFPFQGGSVWDSKRPRESRS